MSGLQPLVHTVVPNMTLFQYIAANNRAEGPFVSGGVVHQISTAMNWQVCGEIAAGAAAFGTDFRLITVLIRGEGNFDPNAFNPNLENAPGAQFDANGHCIKGGAWTNAHLEAANTDYGICQVNGDDSYLGPSQVGRSIEYLCLKINKAIIEGALKQFPIQVAFLSYNKGFDGPTGAEVIWNNLLAKHNGDPVGAMAEPEMEYGRNVLTRYNEVVAAGLK